MLDEVIDDRQHPEASVIAGFEVLEGGLQLSWSDGHTSFFHSIWLRDCCYCSQCGDSYSSKRFVMPHDIPLDIDVDRVVLQPDGSLSIVWKQDGHESRYDSEWLRLNCYDQVSRAARFHRPTKWNSEIASSMPKVVYDSAIRDENVLLSLYRNLRDYGVVLVTGIAPEPGVSEKAAGLIGSLGESAYEQVFDLTTSSAIQTMGNTTFAVAPHTDEAFRYMPPGINVLGCVRPAQDGGETILVDGFYIAESLKHMDPEFFDLLTKYGQTFNRRHPGELDQRCRQRMISLDDRGEVVGIRVHTRSAGPMDLPADLVMPFYSAHRKLCDLITREENQLQYQLQAGEAVIFDNHRVLHARTEFCDRRRFVQICNVDREVFHERLRLLAAKLGYADEANQVLECGMAH